MFILRTELQNRYSKTDHCELTFNKQHGFMNREICIFVLNVTEYKPITLFILIPTHMCIQIPLTQWTKNDQLWKMYVRVTRPGRTLDSAHLWRYLFTASTRLKRVIYVSMERGCPVESKEGSMSCFSALQMACQKSLIALTAVVDWAKQGRLWKTVWRDVD